MIHKSDLADISSMFNYQIIYGWNQNRIIMSFAKAFEVTPVETIP